jgi:hypothetical protein
MDDLNQNSPLYSAVEIEENDFVKLTIPLEFYEIEAGFFSDGWRLENFIKH